MFSSFDWEELGEEIFEEQINDGKWIDALN